MTNIEKISSRGNQRLVATRKIRDGRGDRRIFIEGKRLAEETLRSGIEILECYFKIGFDDDDLLQTSIDKAKTTFELSEKLFDSIADTKNPQGLILIAKRPIGVQTAIEERIRTQNASPPVVLFLKEINNPSNLGAILRTAEAAGVAGVVVSKGSADVFSPKSLRASMGSAFRLPIWENAETAEVVNWAKGLNFISTAADISAAKSYTDIDWSVPRLLVFGSEAHGLEANDLDQIDEKILIPMQNGVESLNLAVSAAVILFEAKRQNDLLRA
ncbi:23S rRNA (guanosine(2251)-2'-O)-methyltransferase RlmB [soil metagenome]